MTVKEWKEELNYYDEDEEVVFEINDDFEPESVTEDRWGNREVHIDSRVKIGFVGEDHGDCLVLLEAEKE